jgi:membrane peptidoglycan carboxypeptidase
MGATSDQIPMRNIGGISPTGGSYPARIWGQYMNAILEGTERVEFRDAAETRRGTALRMPGERGTGTTRPPSTGGTGPTTTAPAGPAPPTTGAPPTTAAPPVTTAPPPVTTAPPPPPDDP